MDKQESFKKATKNAKSASVKKATENVRKAVNFAAEFGTRGVNVKSFDLEK